MREIETEFERALAEVKQLPSQPNEVLLKLYGLYKQATNGDVQGKRPGWFDPRARAKYDAWVALEGTGKQDAKQAYVDLVKELSGSNGSTYQR